MFKIFESHVLKLGVELIVVKAAEEQVGSFEYKRFEKYKKQVILITKDS